MQLDAVLIPVIILFAIAYIAVTFIRKYKRLSDPNSFGCSGSCDHCPFSKDGRAACRPRVPQKSKRIRGFSQAKPAVRSR